MTADEVLRRRREEAERDARDLMAIRDTLALIDRDRYSGSKARRAARECEEVAAAIESRFDSEACYCPRCEEGDLAYQFSDRWTIRCRTCGWAVSGATWEEALDEWNGEAGE
jgi:hypothetical protein